MNIFAFTPAEGSHPPFVSLNEEEGERITLTVRTGDALNAVVNTIELPLEELEIMQEKITSYLSRRLSK